MKTKILAAVIVVATGVLVWAVLSMDRPQQGEVTDTNQAKSASLLVGKVIERRGDRVKFAIGEQEYIFRVTEQTEIVTHAAVVGVLQSGPGTVEDIQPGAQVTVYYMIDKNRPIDAPLIEVDADKVEVRI